MKNNNSNKPKKNKEKNNSNSTIEKLGFKYIKNTIKNNFKMKKNIPSFIKDCITLNDIKDLEINEQEAILNFSDLLQIYNQHVNPCKPNCECIYGGFHLGFKRDSSDILRSYSFECPFKSDYEVLNNFNKNYIYKSIYAEPIQDGLDDVGKDKDIKFEKGQGSIFNSFKKLYLNIKSNKSLKKGFWISNTTTTGKSFCAVAFTNNMAMLNYKVIYIDNFDLVNKITDFENSSVNNWWINTLKDVDVLIIDNFGNETSKSSWYYGSVLPSILDARLNGNKMTGFISNYSRDLLKKNLTTKLKFDSIITNRLFSKIDRIISTRIKEMD